MVYDEIGEISISECTNLIAQRGLLINFIDLCWIELKVIHSELEVEGDMLPPINASNCTSYVSFLETIGCFYKFKEKFVPYIQVHVAHNMTIFFFDFYDTWLY